MQNQLGYIKENCNVIYIENGIEKIAHIGKGRVFENNSDFKTAQAIAKNLPLVDVSNILNNITNEFNKRATETKRVNDIVNSLPDSVVYKLPIKEKNKLKKLIEETANEYYFGSVTVTNSSRGKGGYFKYSDEILNGVFYSNKWKGISIWDGGEVVSNRKKNYTTNYKKIENVDLLKLLVKNIEAKEAKILQDAAKKERANIMLNNLDIFRDKIFNLLTTS